MLQQLGFSISACLYTGLVAKRSGHCQSRHHDIFHPYSCGSDCLSGFVSLRENTSTAFEYSLLLVRPVRFLVDRQWEYHPFILLQHLFMTKLQHFFLILLWLLLLADIRLHLLQKNSPRVPNIEGEQFAQIDKHGHKGGSC